MPGIGPLFNQILVGRFSALLTRLFGMKTGDAPAPTLCPEIQPSIDVNQWDDPSLAFLRGDKIAWAHARRAPAGGVDYASVGIQNPTTSGVLVIVERVAVRSNVAGDLFWLLNGSTTNIAKPVSRVEVADVRWWWRDLRDLGGIEAVASYPFETTSAAAPTFAGSFRHDVIPAGMLGYVEIDPVRIVLPPGSRLNIAHGTATTGDVEATFQWRERALRAEEASNT